MLIKWNSPILRSIFMQSQYNWREVISLTPRCVKTIFLACPSRLPCASRTLAGWTGQVPRHLVWEWDTVLHCLLSWAETVPPPLPHQDLLEDCLPTVPEGPTTSTTRSFPRLCMLPSTVPTYVKIQFLFCNHAFLFHSASWRRGVVCELDMSLNTITDAVRELLSPEQWRIVRCATLIGVHLTEV